MSFRRLAMGTVCSILLVGCGPEEAPGPDDPSKGDNTGLPGCIIGEGSYPFEACVESYGGQGNCVQEEDGYLLTYHEGQSAQGPLHQDVFCTEDDCIGNSIGFPLCDSAAGCIIGEGSYPFEACVESYGGQGNCVQEEDGYLLTYHEGQSAQGAFHQDVFCTEDDCIGNSIGFPLCDSAADPESPDAG